MLKVGDKVRVVNNEWAEGIGRARGVIRSIYETGEVPFREKVAVISWSGSNSKQKEQRFGNKFHLCDLKGC